MFSRCFFKLFLTLKIFKRFSGRVYKCPALAIKNTIPFEGYRKITQTLLFGNVGEGRCRSKIIQVKEIVM